jgi:hypothetical protein
MKKIHLPFILTITLMLTALWSCDPSKMHQDPLRDLAESMTGRFSSATQAASDTNFANVNLAITQIWPGRTDGYWMYVEQALAATPEKPYRQRIYHLQELKAVFTSDIYELPNEAAAVGQYRHPEFFDNLDPSSVTLMNGCTVYLTPKDGVFSGSTLHATCQYGDKGEFINASATIYKNKLESLDQGFNKDGVQIWGSEKGAYVFDKVENFPLSGGHDAHGHTEGEHH